MGMALYKNNRSFTLLIRCSNCLKESIKEVLGGEGGPTDEEELVESGLIQQIRYSCVQCESVIGQLVAITKGELV